MAANATTKVPPMSALMAMIRIGLIDICFHGGNAQIHGQYPAGAPDLRVLNSVGMRWPLT
jgi:hypothetical protein